MSVSAGRRQRASHPWFKGTLAKGISDAAAMGGLKKDASGGVEERKEENGWGRRETRSFALACPPSPSFRTQFHSIHSLFLLSPSPSSFLPPLSPDLQLHSPSSSSSNISFPTLLTVFSLISLLAPLAHRNRLPVSKPASRLLVASPVLNGLPQPQPRPCSPSTLGAALDCRLLG